MHRKNLNNSRIFNAVEWSNAGCIKTTASGKSTFGCLPFTEQMELTDNDHELHLFGKRRIASEV